MNEDTEGSEQVLLGAFSVVESEAQVVMVERAMVQMQAEAAVLGTYYSSLRAAGIPRILASILTRARAQSLYGWGGAWGPSCDCD